MRDGIAFAYITHDISTAKYFSDKILVMYAGKMAEIGPYRDVIRDTLRSMLTPLTWRALTLSVSHWRKP
ncbi:hypothetical protein [Caldivirga sp.]|mgnify:CR=1 FL=1|uniref:hypothetical protein n=1 Tax=Caldivirga sp. TaxID=2080243 RepID=UPI00345B6447